MNTVFTLEGFERHTRGFTANFDDLLKILKLNKMFNASNAFWSRGWFAI
jgi:hypothetical protein